MAINGLRVHGFISTSPPVTVGSLNCGNWIWSLNCGNWIWQYFYNTHSQPDWAWKGCPKTAYSARELQQISVGCGKDAIFHFVPKFAIGGTWGYVLFVCFCQQLGSRFVCFTFSGWFLKMKVFQFWCIFLTMTELHASDLLVYLWASALRGPSVFWM